MVRSTLRRVEQLVAERLAVEEWKKKALKVGARGMKVALEGALSAMKAVDQVVDQFQMRVLPQDLEAQGGAEPVTAPSIPINDTPAMRSREPSEQLRGQMQATATRVLDEARAVEQRLKQARPARRPLQVTVEVDGSGARTKGRKTAPTATAARRVTAPQGGFKAKRGQKHSH